MKLVDLKCPSCGAKLRVNSELEEATCNYCGSKFLVEDENETKEERIIKAIGKEKEKDRKYYSSDEYKKKILTEKSGKFSALINTVGEQVEKNRNYINSEEYKKKQRDDLKLAGKILFILFTSLIIISIIAVIANNNKTIVLNCKTDNNEYIISIKKNNEIKCALCESDMLNELNIKYLDKKDADLTEKNIKAYFKNKNGNCE